MLLIRTLFYIIAFLLFIYPLWAVHKTGSRWLNHDSLHRQPVFWVTVMWSTSAFLLFGSEVWFNYMPSTTEAGYTKFLEISKLPLGILASGLAAAAFIASIHRSIQTAKQIEKTEVQIRHSELKSEDEAEDRTKDTAVMCLEKAFELLNNEGKPTRHADLWSATSDLINDYNSIKITINKSEIKRQLETQEKYWKAKLKAVLAQTSQDDFYFTKAKGASKNTMISIANFCNSDVVAKHIEKGQGKVIYQDESRELRTAYYPKPKDVMEDAVLAGPSDDPAVTEERRRRGLE